MIAPVMNIALHIKVFRLYGKFVTEIFIRAKGALKAVLTFGKIPKCKITEL